MVSITPYAEVVGRERVARALVGVPGPDGTPLRGKPLGEPRAEADADAGRYLLPLSGSSGDLIARMAELTGDADCREVLDAGHVAVSLDHLDGLDDGTRVGVGFRIDLTDEESLAEETVTTVVDHPDPAGD
jgi:hypothetical protein